MFPLALQGVGAEAEKAVLNLDFAQVAQLIMNSATSIV